MKPRVRCFTHPARLGIAVGISTLVQLAAVSSAAAALSFTFDRASARPGMIFVASEPGWPSAPAGLTVYLVPTRLPRVKPDPAGGYLLRHPPKDGIVKLSRPRPTRAHRLAIRFRVPPVRPGEYTIGFWCRTCKKGGDFFASAPWGAAWTGSPGTVLRITR
jgi:hypothetical protein